MPKTFKDCVQWARDQFEVHWHPWPVTLRLTPSCRFGVEQEEYHNKIQQLLTTFPADSLTSSGQPFWCVSKLIVILCVLCSCSFGNAQVRAEARADRDQL